MTENVVEVIEQVRLWTNEHRITTVQYKNTTENHFSWDNALPYARDVARDNKTQLIHYDDDGIVVAFEDFQFAGEDKA